MTADQPVALVTGAASGIARALCPLLGGEGMRLIAMDRDAQRLDCLARELTVAEVPNVAAAVDVTDRQAVREAVRSGANDLGPVDLLVACAGITDVTLLDDLDVGRLERLVQVNLLGLAYTIDAVLPGMLQRGRGHIVGVSSLAGIRGMPFSAGYSASKAAVLRYLESLRPALRRRGVTVTTVCPGFVRTPLMENAEYRPPMHMMEPEQAARHVLKAIRRRRRFYSFPWNVGLAARVLQWLPADLYDWTMGWTADQYPQLKY